MIVRIQGEGQYTLDDSAQSELDRLDSQLFAAIESDDEAGYEASLKAVVDCIQTKGAPLPEKELVASDIILPASDTTLDEAKALLTDEGYLKPVEA